MLTRNCDVALLSYKANSYNCVREYQNARKSVYFYHIYRLYVMMTFHSLHLNLTESMLLLAHIYSQAVRNKTGNKISRVVLVQSH